MKKANMLRRSAAVCLVLALLLSLLSTAALADLKRGSKGSEVAEIQTMLTEIGFLDDKIDGAFGKKTEAAVKRFQKFAGLKQTGRVDDETLWTMQDCYFTATGVMEGDGLDPEELQEMCAAYCCWTTEIDGEGAELCWRHQEEDRVGGWFYRADAPVKLETLLAGRLIELWTLDIDAMYDDWEERLPEADKHIAGEQRDLFHEMLEDEAGWNESNTKQNPIGGLQVKAVWVEAHGIDLCYDLYGQEAEGLGPDDEDPGL